MFQTIPLGTGLRIDVKFIVERNQAVIGEIFNSMLELHSPETGVVQMIHGPVQLDMLSMNDFLCCCPDYVRREEIQSC